MKRLKHVYDDPTGSGDDITLEAPVWVDPPSHIRVRDWQGDSYDFTLSEEGLDDEDEDEA